MKHYEEEETFQKTAKSKSWTGKQSSRKIKQNSHRKSVYKNIEFDIQEFSSCKRKIGYLNERMVQKALEENSQFESNQLYYYQCPSCKQYHLTHNPEGNDVIHST